MRTNPIHPLSDKQINRFWSKAIRGTNDECWAWTSAHSSKGYGLFTINGQNFLAHRISYFLANGPLIAGMTIDHECRNRECVNPGHLRLVTNKVNVLSGSGPTAVNAAKTTCKRGHPLSDDNVRVFNGMRHCVACCRIRSKAYRDRRSLARRQENA